VDRVQAIGTVCVPDLNMDDPHPLVSELYLALQESAQSRYYEPSDWSYAKFALHFADHLLKAHRPSAQLLATVQTMMSDLLMSEASRRRVRLEVERSQAEGAVLDVADMFRARLAQG
jgi:hypothetical protein